MNRGTAAGRTRLGSALAAAGLTNGPIELLDFLIPLWAGIALHATPAQVGFLVAVELIVSFFTRPVAGYLADTRKREVVAALGALLYGLSCLGYALAGSLSVAYGAAVVGGLGGALLWVALRAMVGEQLRSDSGVFARLMSVQETGVWIAFVAGLLLLGQFDSFPLVFRACAGACLIGALILFLSPTTPTAHPALQADGTVNDHEGSRIPAPPVTRSARVMVQSLRPMLIATVVTALAETMVAILLLLRLQRDLDLDVIEIAYVFLPGAIALGVLPPVLHTLVLRIGRRRAMAAGSVLSGLFAISLAYAAGPVVVAALWVLCGVAWAMVIPIEQAVVTEKYPLQLGAAMGIYTATTLIGAAIGASLAGILYDVVPWPVTCMVAGAIILSGAVLGPWAITRLGVADKPAPSTPEPRPTGPVA
ncbi:MFS transporter [uncultured Arthrobacter sp.]|uniref:MFS transporter n=1 Tax=uncultured Arthrobacter sp. TaxID=114050 RepID=UPI0026076610|nr:MFS transporter [uncultured Arthrobacter sp.]